MSEVARERVLVQPWSVQAEEFFPLHSFSPESCPQPKVFVARSMRSPSSKPIDWPLIEIHSAFKELCCYLRCQPEIGIDTEFKSKELCLIQVSCQESAWLIDSKSVGDLTPFFSILKSEKTIKIFHACRADIEHLHRAANNIVDIQVLAAYANFGAQLSYKDLVKELLGIQLTKTETLSDWSKRPLTEKQKEYAAEDVKHLSACYEKLLEQLKGTDRLAWALEDCQSLCKETPANKGPSDLDFTQEKMRNLMKLLKDKKEAIAKELNLHKSLVCSEPLLKLLIVAWLSGKAEATSFPARLQGWRAKHVVAQLKSVFDEWQRLLDFPPLSLSRL